MSGGLGMDIAQIAGGLLEDFGTNAWYAVLAPEEEVVATQLLRELNGIDPESAAWERATTPAEFVAVCQRDQHRRLLLTGASTFDASAWVAVDESRSRLMRRGVVALVLSPAAFGDLQRSAPNLASWIGGSVFTVVEASQFDREARLAELRAWEGLSDEDLIARAEEGLLEPDPYFAEWLVLLGRGDLLGQR